MWSLIQTNTQALCVKLEKGNENKSQKCDNYLYKHRDLAYIEKVSLKTDIKIILKTLPVVVKNDKVDFTNHDELSKHTGSLFDDVGIAKSK